jgi:WD40 repeat protein
MDSSNNAGRQLEFRGFMKGREALVYLIVSGHNGWVTSMQVGEITEGEVTREFLVSGGRDKSLIIWDIQEKADSDPEKEWGAPKKVLRGRSFYFRISDRNRPLSLHQRLESLSRQQILPHFFLGRYLETLGLEKGFNH